jgi:hypothetical protein
LTKASKATPFREDLLVVVEDQKVHGLLSFLMKLRTPTLTDWPTTKLYNHLRSKNLPYGASSIKRGAINVLVKCAAAGKLDPALIRILAKHKTATPLFPDTTVRYVEDRASLARAIGTQNATRLL